MVFMTTVLSNLASFEQDAAGVEPHIYCESRP
jgi:hypothetical protein